MCAKELDEFGRSSGERYIFHGDDSKFSKGNVFFKLYFK